MGGGGRPPIPINHLPQHEIPPKADYCPPFTCTWTALPMLTETTGVETPAEVLRYHADLLDQISDAAGPPRPTGASRVGTAPPNASTAGAPERCSAASSKTWSRPTS